jgi:hypothetical protein
MDGVREDRMLCVFLRDFPLAHGCLALRDGNVTDEEVNDEKAFVSIHILSLKPILVLLYCEVCEHCVAFCVGTFPRSGLASLLHQMVWRFVTLCGPFS